ncbi:MAG: type II secretion system F family protein [Methanoregula sp.]|nr:type II secretion system F family protein [Methanoregula sp.]
MNSFERLSFNLLGMRIKERRSHFTRLRNDLISARLKKPFEAYLATAYISSLLAGMSGAVFFGLICWFFRFPQLIIAKTGISGSFQFLSGYTNIVGSITISILAFVVFAGITYEVFILYPSVVAGTRQRNIDANLPYAINYITSMATAGITPDEVFRLLGDSPIYGECAVEARYIAREIDIFGRDLIEAIRIVSVYTPSARMKEFLQGAMASISSGGNLTDYFHTKSDQYALENRQTQKQFLETLALISESYVTVMVAGVLFLIILQSIMSVLGGDNKPIFLYIIIYLIIPFGTIMFIIMISIMTPEA